MQSDFSSETAPALTSDAAAFAVSSLGRALMEAQGAGSASQKIIADALLRAPFQASAMSIEEMAAFTGVSTATLSRFARAVGFEGYPDLRHALVSAVQNGLRPVEKLSDTFERGSDASPLRGGLEATLANLRSSAEALSPQMLAGMAQRLAQARAVYVMGFGLSTHLAGLLGLGLEAFCQRVINVAGQGGTENAAARLTGIGAEDVLIAISFPRYSRDILHLTRYAADRGAWIIAITDSVASPLQGHANEVLLAQAAHPVLSSSNAAAVLVIEALVTALMVSNKDNVAKAAQLTEIISDYLYAGNVRVR
ncbi:MAG: MurR/RpiR family transcriptional regulator [Bosea sp. (in: a-proteobacteria)]